MSASSLSDRFPRTRARRRPHRWLWLMTCGAIVGCGARTSEDDLIGYSRDGGTAGGASTGGNRSTGGEGAGGNTGGAGTGATGGGFVTGGSGGQREGSCCSTRGTPGCDTVLVEECVCAGDAYCCAEQWDQACVDQADARCFAGCTIGTGGAGGTGGVAGTGGLVGTGGVVGTGGAIDPGSCCEVQSSPSCNQPVLSSCVCQIDEYCCETAWDALCVEEVSLCGTSCGGAAGTGGAIGTGGAVGTGGAIGTGGSTGWVCEASFPGECGECLCNSCDSELDACRTDTGCFSILWCIEATGCEGFECYQADTCRGIIDAFGGISGASSQRALGLYACTAFSGCPCN